MATITDVEKLAPDLLTKSKAQLEREITERQMAIADLERQELIKAKEELAAKANDHIDAIISGAKFLHDNGILPERVTQALSRNDGTFNPGTFLRQVSAEQLVPREHKPRGAKKPRRVRDKKTGELVPSKAMKGA